ncbi:iron uptake porin [Microcoleus sp. FACHB-1515]|uniref:iron uptake porin n=1 Tax=Cyanophyceae TaxID=3028117 RepID=UPI0016854597|nr:iron uptake porin [Microcoleus sp. FACHB-1515]MBD2089437.1 iron uptake porin [Microcoleus sp. FACHB-1515]
MLPKIIWNSLLIAPAALSAALLVSPSAIAADAQVADMVEASVADLSVETTEVQTDAVAEAIQATPAEVAALSLDAPAATDATSTDATAAIEVPAAVTAAPAEIAQVPAAPMAAPATTAPEVSIDQIMQYGNEGAATQDQVTSISQLSDVQPTDWAFQALQSLVERYGCIAGYPDGTYRGQRATTRFEFAAGLNACLDRVNELIQAGLQDVVTQEDLAALQRLQEEFAAELATLRGRVDALEARTAELEANQFSTTTVLRGRTIFSLNDIFGGEDLFNEDDTNTVFQSRVRLNFDTSFTGEDRLRARLQWGNFNGFAQRADAGANPVINDALFASQTSLSYGTDTDGNVRLSRLEYYFPVGDATTIYIEALGASISDIVSSISSFDDPEQGSISYFGYNPIYDIAPGRGIGAGATFDFSDNLQLGFGYLTGAGDEPSEDLDGDTSGGLFSGDYAAFGQLTFGLGDSPLTAALTYVNSYRDNLILNAYGVSAQFAINDAFFVGGWASYYDVDELDGAGDATFWTYAGTLGVADLGVEGSLLGLIVGVPPRQTFLEVQGDRVTAGTEDAALHAELFYRLPLTDNITITPGIIWLQDPGNNNDNDDLVIGALRTSFSF